MNGKIEVISHNNDPDLHEKVSGSSLKGYIKISYDELVKKFGQPCDGDGYKVDAEWIIQFSDGTVATIYNWKNGPNYCGHGAGIEPKLITEWHIGGHDMKVIKKLQKLFPKNHIEPFSINVRNMAKTIGGIAIITFIVCTGTMAAIKNFASSAEPVSAEQFNEN